MLSPKERERQDRYNEYVIWRLELLHSNSDQNSSEVSSFEGWHEAMYSDKKPKIRKRKRNDRKKKQTAHVRAT